LTATDFNLDVFIIAEPDCNTHCLNSTSRGCERFVVGRTVHVPGGGEHVVLHRGRRVRRLLVSVTKVWRRRVPRPKLWHAMCTLSRKVARCCLGGTSGAGWALSVATVGS